MNLQNIDKFNVILSVVEGSSECVSKEINKQGEIYMSTKTLNNKAKSVLGKSKGTNTPNKSSGSNGYINRMRLELVATSLNESFARSTVAAFASSIDPTLDEINDIKTAVSEAVTNCVVHAYGLKSNVGGATEQTVVIECELYESHINISITDRGLGIKDVENAMQPFVTTRADEERSGMGFTVMQSFMDSLNVQSKEGSGTTVTMQKFFMTCSQGEHINTIRNVQKRHEKSLDIKDAVFTKEAKAKQA